MKRSWTSLSHAQLRFLRLLLIPFACSLICRAIIVHAQSRGGDDTRWSASSVPVRFDSIFRYVDRTTAIRFESASTGYARWSGRESGNWRTLDGGRTWSAWPYLTPYAGATVAGQWGIARAADINGEQHPVFTSSGPMGWRLLDSITNTTDLVCGPLLRTGLPRVMARYYYHGYTMRLAYTLDDGTTWIYPDSISRPKIDTVVIPPGSNRYDTSFAVDRRTQFGSAPATEAGTFRWDQLLGVVDSTLYLTSVVPGTGAESGEYHWRINLADKTATITPIPDVETRTYIRDANWAYPGLMVAPAIVAPPALGALARSTDFGLTWNVVQSEHEIDLRTLRFLSHEYGICRTAYTTDAGNTWHPWHASFDTVIYDFHAFDSLQLFASSSIGFHWSTDAGRTWGGALKSTFNGIWAGSGAMLAMRGVNGLVRTIDSGESWQPVAVPAGVLQIGPVAEIDPKNRPGELIAIARSRHVAFDSESVVVQTLRSMDTGASWSAVASAPQFSTNLWLARIPGTRGDLLPALAFVPNVNRSGVTGYLRAQDSILYRTVDDGETWEKTSDTQITGFSFSNDNVGIAARYGEILRTEDGGRTWAQVTVFPRTQPKAVGLMMFDTLQCSAILPDLVNPGRSAIHSTDGGWTWSQRRSGSDIVLRDPLFWISRSHVYGVSYGGIYLSTDSGRVFQSMHPGLPKGGVSDGLYDGHYIYYVKNNYDTAVIGRWRVDEGTSSVPIRPAGELGGVCRLRLEGSPPEHIVIDIAALRRLPGRISLIDLRGNEVAHVDVDGEASVRFDARWLPNGFYAAVVRCGGNRNTLPFMLVK